MEVGLEHGPQVAFELSDSSHAGEARRAVVRCAEQIGMSETDRGSLAIAVTELATNVLKHANHGKLMCETLTQNGSRGLRVISLDTGPGIRDLQKALQDGYSTAGSNGSGLGAVRRLATTFDIYTVPQHGTCVLAEFWEKKKAPHASALQVGAVSLPMRGEDVCGDGWTTKTCSESMWLMVVDGLGHGSLAAEAAQEAERILAQSQSGSPAAVLRDCHNALKKTRGAAVAIALVETQKRTLCFSGLGNITATLLTPDNSRGLASHNGTVGHHIGRTQEFTFPWNEDSVLIMHSDGLATRWDLQQYPGLWSKHPSIMAAVLYRDFARERDDVTVLVAKNSSAPLWP